ncbi:MAG: cache domain-containing protein [Coriobacteriia bacterium]|nr:cache domain-containing protein [Coriobacteriia bacterium]
MSIKLKVAAIVIGLFVLAGAAVLWTTQSLYLTAIDRASATSVATAQSAFAALEQQDAEKLAAANDVLRSRTDLRDAFVAGDREKLFTLAEPIFNQLRENYAMTHLYFELPAPESKIFLRVHAPDKFDDVNARDTYKSSVESGTYGIGKDLGKTAFALRAVHPWADESGKVVGYVETGQEIEEFLDIMSEQSGDQYTLLLSKDRLDAAEWATMRENRGDANDWDRYEALVAAHSTGDAPREAVVDTLDIGGLSDVGDVVTGIEGGADIVTGAFPVKNTMGERVGAVVVAHDISALQSQLAAARTQTMLILSAVGVILVLVIVLMLNGLVFNRLDGMIEHMRDASVRLAGGDFDISMPASESNDEIGRFERFFATFIEAVSATLKQLSK